MPVSDQDASVFLGVQCEAQLVEPGGDLVQPGGGSLRLLCSLWIHLQEPLDALSLPGSREQTELDSPDK